MFPYSDKTSSQLSGHIFPMLCKYIDSIHPDLLLIACNTATCNSIEHIRKRYPTLLHVGVEPGVKYISKHTKSSLAGVLVTASTNTSKNMNDLVESYSQEITILRKGSKVLALEAEKFIFKGEVNTELLEREIKSLFHTDSEGNKTDIVALGCTHYPLLIQQFKDVAPWQVHWFDPAPAVVSQVNNLIGFGSKKPNKITFVYTSQSNSTQLETAWGKIKEMKEKAIF